MDKLTIEDIKYICEKVKPEGFSIIKIYDEYIRLRTHDGLIFSIKTINPFKLGTPFLLLLQKTIESINEIDDIFIQQMKKCIIVVIKISEDVIDSTDYDFCDYNSKDEAKQHAIKYIIDHLRSNQN